MPATKAVGAITARTILAALFTCRMTINPLYNTALTDRCEQVIQAMDPKVTTKSLAEAVAHNKDCQSAMTEAFRTEFKVPLSDNQLKHFHRTVAPCFLLRRVSHKQLQVHQIPSFMLALAYLSGNDPVIWAWKDGEDGDGKYKTAGPVYLIAEKNTKLRIDERVNTEEAWDNLTQEQKNEIVDDLAKSAFAERNSNKHNESYAETAASNDDNDD